MASAGTALYYPNLHVRSDWLKCALLYWDRVRRIVPESAEKELVDPADCKIARKEGLLINLDPADYLESTEQRFRKAMSPLFKVGQPALPKWYQDFGRKFFPPGASRTLLIHSGKMSPALWDQIQWLKFTIASAQGVAFEHIRPNPAEIGKSIRSRNWLRVPETLAAFYMICLGAEASQRSREPLLTDDPTYSEAGKFLLFGKAPAAVAQKPPRTMLLHFGLRYPEPSDLNQVPMKSLVKFHRRFAAERIAFRSMFEELTAKASTFTDHVEFEDFVADKRQELRIAVADHRKRMKELQIGSLSAFLKISVPSMIPATAAHLTGVMDSTALGVAGLAVAGAAWWAEFRGKKDKLVKECPWHYAVRVEKKFSRN